MKKYSVYILFTIMVFSCSKENFTENSNNVINKADNPRYKKDLDKKVRIMFKLQEIEIPIYELDPLVMSRKEIEERMRESGATEHNISNISKDFGGLDFFINGTEDKPQILTLEDYRELVCMIESTSQSTSKEEKHYPNQDRNQVKEDDQDKLKQSFSDMEGVTISRDEIESYLQKEGCTQEEIDTLPKDLAAITFQSEDGSIPLPTCLNEEEYRKLKLESPTGKTVSDEDHKKGISCVKDLLLPSVSAPPARKPLEIQAKEVGDGIKEILDDIKVKGKTDEKKVVETSRSIINLLGFRKNKSQIETQVFTKVRDE